MTNKYYLLHLLFWSLLSITCQKQVGKDYREKGNTSSLQNFFTGQLKSEMVTSTVKSSEGGIITGKKGSTLFISPNAFIDINGQPINGTLDVNFLEILSPADMILKNRATMSGDRPLESGGAFYVDVKYNGLPAKLAPGQLIRIGLKEPSAALPGMQVFKGEVLDSTDGINWVPDNNQGNLVRADSTGGIDLFSDSVQWINCDRLMNEPNISCSFTPSNPQDIDSSVLYVHLSGRNSVLRVREKDAGGFKSSTLIAGPATVVSILVKGGKLYAFTSPVQLKQNTAVAMTLKETTEKELATVLEKLK